MNPRPFLNEWETGQILKSISTADLNATTCLRNFPDFLVTKISCTVFVAGVIKGPEFHWIACSAKFVQYQSYLSGLTKLCVDPKKCALFSAAMCTPFDETTHSAKHMWPSDIWSICTVDGMLTKNRLQSAHHSVKPHIRPIHIWSICMVDGMLT